MSEESLTKEKKLEDIRKDAEQRACALQKMLCFVDEFIEGPMCGKCFPCALGTGEARIRLRRIIGRSENVSEEDLAALKRIGLNMTEGSFCKKGKDTGRFILDVLTKSEEECRQHISGVCPAKECVTFVEYAIDPQLCVMCGKCAEVCKYGAIIGEKRVRHLSGYLPFEIRKKRCTRCGECVGVCPTGAIASVSAVVEELIGR